MTCVFKVRLFISRTFLYLLLLKSCYNEEKIFILGLENLNMGKMTENAIRVLFNYGKKAFQGDISLKEAAEKVH